VNVHCKLQEPKSNGAFRLHEIMQVRGEEFLQVRGQEFLQVGAHTNWFADDPSQVQGT